MEPLQPQHKINCCDINGAQWNKRFWMSCEANGSMKVWTGLERHPSQSFSWLRSNLETTTTTLGETKGQLSILVTCNFNRHPRITLTLFKTKKAVPTMLCYSEMPLNYLRVFRRMSWYPVCDTIFTKESTMLFSVTFKNIKYFHCISILHIQPLSKNYGVSWAWLCMGNQVNNT